MNSDIEAQSDATEQNNRIDRFAWCCAVFITTVYIVLWVFVLTALVVLMIMEGIQNDHKGLKAWNFLTVIGFFLILLILWLHNTNKICDGYCRLLILLISIALCYSGIYIAVNDIKQNWITIYVTIMYGGVVLCCLCGR